jgi:hypothetical protein
MVSLVINTISLTNMGIQTQASGMTEENINLVILSGWYLSSIPSIYFSRFGL